MNTNIPSLSHDALTPWFDKIALIHDCVAQVQKDLGNYGISLVYSGVAQIAYEELFAQLQPQISTLLHSSTKLMEILYRVDVNESQLEKVAKSGEDLSFAITRLILWRELQKVVTRFLLRAENQSSEDADS